MIKAAITIIFFFSAFGAAHVLIPRGRYVTFYLVAALLFGMAVGRDLPDLYRLSKNGTITQGTVKGLDCADHGHIAYEFQIGGRAFSNAQMGWVGGLHCSDLRVGMDVPVQFLADSPRISVAGRARQGLSEELGGTVIVMFGFPALMLFLYFRKLR